VAPGGEEGYDKGIGRGWVTSRRRTRVQHDPRVGPGTSPGGGGDIFAAMLQGAELPLLAVASTKRLLKHWDVNLSHCQQKSKLVHKFLYTKTFSKVYGGCEPELERERRDAYPSDRATTRHSYGGNRIRMCLFRYIWWDEIGWNHIIHFLRRLVQPRASTSMNI
jgi:hypothetical protein